VARDGSPVVVCLCGSTRFKSHFLAAAESEALAGRVVLMPGMFSKSEGKALSVAQASSLGVLHRRKIDMADEILVIDPGGYVGEATATEIEYAEQLGKRIRRLSELDVRQQAVPIDPVEALVESHRVQLLVTNHAPTLDVPTEVKELRCALIEEEAAEFRAALEADDLIETADAIADLLYVIYGAALTFGIPVREVFSEVHRSNMTKLGNDGLPVYRADGKVMKGPNFSPPNLRPILMAAGWSGD
jgi:predicted HAD superfamily Cof-like phosphohydrolase